VPRRRAVVQLHPVPQTTVVIIMGTFVPQIIDFVYQPLADLFISHGYAVKMLAIPCLGLGALDGAADMLTEQVFSDDLNARYILVGHSQGGVHTLDLASRRPKQVLAVFNFAAPHHGTHLANLGHWVSWIPAIRGMEAHSRHLHNLRGVHEFEVEKIHSLFTVFDQLVVPWFASNVYGARNVVLMPRGLHRFMTSVGFRRSEGVELIHGYADHLFVIWHKRLHEYIEAELVKLERST